MISQFENLGLSPQLLETIQKMGFEQPTPIQKAAIPVLLEGRDVVGQAQTGTGKTAAFVLPMLQHIDPKDRKTVQALIMAPTRELAIQVTEAANQMADQTSIRVMTVYGGQAYNIQIRQLKRGVNVVVGTPGRMLDLIRKNLLDLSKTRYLVLDEADEMLKMGFIDDVETIMDQIPAEHQTAIFSATLPKPIRKLANKYLNNPHEITINPKRLTVEDIEQRYYKVHRKDKLEVLSRLLEVEDVKSALIFSRTRAGSRELADELLNHGYAADALNGDLDQVERERVLNRFRENTITILVATDVAARGLDIENVSHVINFDIPEHPEDYVHRIGRTGRAGRKGIAITLLTPSQLNRLDRIQGYTKQKLVKSSVPTREEISARRDELFLERLTEKLGKGNISKERAIISELAETSFDMMDIAAAAIQLARESEPALSKQEINEPGSRSKSARSKRKGDGKSFSRDSKKKSRRNKREREVGMVRLQMNLGNKHRVHPSDVVGAIASEVGIPGNSIGQIDIHKSHTFVDVSEKHVGKVLMKSNGQFTLRGKPVWLKIAKPTQTT